ncbi:MAG: hypothetical protein CMF79_01235 [Candidatus Marinimicrobia bacterium]|jgi:hypothetical protein|nr:hypothetical protein [Candidatus Neomarinimicrobiota bacterium]
MKRVDIYFVIYLSAIVSFFALEGELRTKKQQQEKTLLQVASYKLRDLIDISFSDLSDYENDKIDLKFKIKGDFNKDSFKSDIVFKRKTKEQQDSIQVLKFPLKLNDSKDWYFYQATTDDFGNLFDKTFDVGLEVKFNPHISDQTYTSWIEDFGGTLPAKKLLKHIRDEKEITINKNLNFKFSPTGQGERLNPSIFFADQEIILLDGLTSKIPLIINNIPPKRLKYFNLNVTEGKSFVKKIQKNVPETKLTMLGSESMSGGNLTIVGTQINTGKTTTAKINVKVIKPRFEEFNEAEIYVNDEYFFDGRIVDIPSQDISMKISGDFVNKSIDGDFFQFPKFTKPGNINIQMYVYNQKISLKHSVNVVPPPPPSINLISRDGNNLNFEFYAFGNGNEISFRALGGIAGSTEVSVDKSGHKTIYKYRIIIQRPQKPPMQKIKFRLKDNFGERVVWEKPIKYSNK